MSFFKQEAEFAKAGEAEPSLASPSQAKGVSSGKGAPLFRQSIQPAISGRNQQHQSLSDYIASRFEPPPVDNQDAKPSFNAFVTTSQHPKPQNTSEAQTERQDSNPFIPLPSVKLREAPRQGQFLNNLDGELGAGLEGYLPTPLFRLRVMKKRLDDEIGALQTRLNKYERLPEKSSEMQNRVTSLTERLVILEAHQQQVNQELSGMLTFEAGLQDFGRYFKPFGQVVQRSGALLQQALASLFYSPDFFRLETAENELVLLKELFEERLKDPTVSDTEISHLYGQYERLIHQLEANTARFDSRPFIMNAPMRLWQHLARLVQ